MPRPSIFYLSYGRFNESSLIEQHVFTKLLNIDNDNVILRIWVSKTHLPPSAIK